MANTLNLFRDGTVGFHRLVRWIDADLAAWLRAENLAVEKRPRFVALVTVKDRVGFREL
jgi:hypothetical protein